MAGPLLNHREDERSHRPEGLVGVARQRPYYDRAVVRETVRSALSAGGVRLLECAAPGSRVLLKPNLIREAHTHRQAEWEHIITHAEFISAVAWEIADALRGRGQITIADSPQTDSDFQLLRERAGLDCIAEELARKYPALDVSIVDLRRETWRTERGVVVERRRNADAPGGYVCIDLGENSAFAGKSGNYYGADYDSAFTSSHHSGGRHRYLIARLALDCDLFVNLPKLKTHKKVGVTLSLKNLVGINGDKNYLPHFSQGTPAQGGDEFPDDSVRSRLQVGAIGTVRSAMARWPSVARAAGPLMKAAGEAVFGRTEETVRSGNWYGNDTAWRMVLDLNKALFHFDGDGRRRTRPLSYISIVDGIVAGEGNGPMEADPLPCGLVLAGRNPVAVDMIGAKLMGFDWQKIPMIREAYRQTYLPLASFTPGDVLAVPELGQPFHFRPHFGWEGHIES